MTDIGACGPNCDVKCRTISVFSRLQTSMLIDNDEKILRRQDWSDDRDSAFDLESKEMYN